MSKKSAGSIKLESKLATGAGLTLIFRTEIAPSSLSVLSYSCQESSPPSRSFQGLFNAPDFVFLPQ